MELNIDDNTRESLKSNISLEDWQRLETVLKTWIESHSSPVINIQTLKVNIDQ